LVPPLQLPSPTEHRMAMRWFALEFCHGRSCPWFNLLCAGDMHRHRSLLASLACYLEEGIIHVADQSASIWFAIPLGRHRNHVISRFSFFRSCFGFTISNSRSRHFGFDI